MTPTGRIRPPAEDGFILIEVLVSAIMIVIVAGAVLTLVIATTHSAASERLHSEAFALAQEDQANLRSMRISSLNGLKQTRQVTLDGNKFTIESTGLFVNNTTGTASCTAGASSADYVRITSTVTWPGSRQPVVIQSIVSPSNGSLDPSHGTLNFSAVNAAGEPLAGVAVSGTGAGSFSGVTESSGCAVFADLPSGNYSMTTTAGGLVNPSGETSSTETVGVIPSGTQTVTLRYDRGGTIPVKFKYRVGSSTEFKPASADSVVVYNAEMPKGAKAFGNPGGGRETTFKATPLFPFKSADTVYAGSCESNNPNPGEKNPSGTPAMANIIVPPGAEATPTPVLQLPALNLTVTYNGKAVSGARVTVTDVACKESKGSFVKRVYTTNANGYMSETAAGEPAPGLPWGKYNVCVSATVKGTETRRVQNSSVAVENLTGGTSLLVELSNGEKGQTCP